MDVYYQKLNTYIQQHQIDCERLYYPNRKIVFIKAVKIEGRMRLPLCN